MGIENGFVFNWVKIEDPVWVSNGNE